MSSRRIQHRQRGFSLATAIFILVIMALLAVAALSVMRTGAQGAQQETLSTRAFYAAESGAQTALGRVFSLSGGAAVCTASSTLNFTTNGLAGCSSTFTCSSTTIGTTAYYSITSTGVCGSGNDRAVRQVQLQARTL